MMTCFFIIIIKHFVLYSPRNHSNNMVNLICLIVFLNDYPSH